MGRTILLIGLLWGSIGVATAQVVPPELRGRIDAERSGIHDANRLRTLFYNFGMVGDYQSNPDLSVFHSSEAPKGSGINYSDGVTPFVLAKVQQRSGSTSYIMETGYRERQGLSPVTNKVMRFEPRPGYFQIDPNINKGRSVAMSNDPRTWPDKWVDKLGDADDPGWAGDWNGYFGKKPNADQESYSVMDDNFYDAWDYFPDSRDPTRRGLGLRLSVRGFQWANPQAQNVIFWQYDITNESTTDYDDNIVFGLYMDSGVGGSQLSCDGIYESDDDNAYYSTDLGEDLVYTWDKNGTGVGLNSSCAKTGYLGYAYLETPGNKYDGLDNDEDGITDESREDGPGQKIEGQTAILAYLQSKYDLTKFAQEIAPLTERPAYRLGVWWTGDEDLDWVPEFHDTGADGIFGTNDTGEGDGIPTAGEPNFDKTDVNESDQIGLTGFKFNRIKAGSGNGSTETDNIIFFDDSKEWPRRLWEQFSATDPTKRFDQPLAANYNIGFVFASGPFKLKAGATERFSLALAYGSDLEELKDNVKVVSRIYDANYQFATPPPKPNVQAFADDKKVTLVWDNVSEKTPDPVTNLYDFEGYRVYRSTDPNFLDAQLIFSGRGTGPVGNGKPIAQYDLKNGIRGFTNLAVQGVQYWLGEDSGIQHAFVDTTVVNGQTYYYGVTAYDRGSEEYNFYPSENSIAVSRTLRGGTILPSNVVEVRPNKPVPGYIRPKVQDGSLKHISGDGQGTIDLKILNPKAIKDGHTYQIVFTSPADSVRATSYSLVDKTDNVVVFSGSEDLNGLSAGVTGDGLLPNIKTPKVVAPDATAGFLSGYTTTAKLAARYASSFNINRMRPGFPDDIVIAFSDVEEDMSLAAIGAPARPSKFTVKTASGEKLKFRFRDVNSSGTLDEATEFIEVLTYLPEKPTTPQATWDIRLASGSPTSKPPTKGDTYKLTIARPYQRGDVFEFKVDGERIDETQAQTAFDSDKPYVVPNPYVASASFEPERFAVSGRGVRRMEFRNIPTGATVRIYTARGELVQTLEHDGSTVGMIPWDLRSKDNLEVAPGLYIYHVDAGELGTYTDKFAIIK